MLPNFGNQNGLRSEHCTDLLQNPYHDGSLGVFSLFQNFHDLQNPSSPIDEGGYSTAGYSHDAQVITYNGPDTDYTGREIYIGSQIYNDVVTILDVA